MRQHFGHILSLISLIVLPACSDTHALATPASAVQECGIMLDGLVVAELPESSVEPTLSYADGAAGRMKIDHVARLSGPCAGSVKKVLMELVRLNDGSIYRVDTKGAVAEAPSQAMSAFQAEDLSDDEVPTLGDARFIDADDYMALRTQSGLERRYVGLWTDGRRWTIASFTVPGWGGKGSVPRPLLSSTLPLRSVSFFPSLDTPSGGLFLVQVEPSKDVRVIRLLWTHENAVGSQDG